MNIPMEQQLVTVALRALIARAEALPAGEVEHHVQACAHELAAACLRGADIRPAVDRLAAAIGQLQSALKEGPRRRERHDAPAIERLLETLQETLIPELRTSGLL